MSILEMSLSGGAMILAAALVRLLAGDRLPRRGCVALWLASAVRLLVPFAIPSRLSALNLLSLAGTGAALPGGAAEGGAAHPALTALWLAGAAAMAAAGALSYFRCVRTFRTSLPAENEAVARCLAQVHLRRRVAVRTLPELRTPLTYGVLRPVILLPEAAEDWDGERIHMVLWHELTHIRRFDGALKLLAAAAVCVHWWNPAVWLMAALLGRDMELACDGAVAERRVRSILSHRRSSRTAVCLSVLLAAVLTAVFATTPLPESSGAAPDASPPAGSTALMPGAVTEKDPPRVPESAPSHLPAFKDGEDGPPPAEHPIEKEPFPEPEEVKSFVIPVVPGTDAAPSTAPGGELLD